MLFTAEYLHQRLALLPKAKRYLVGFSGGLDSQVLLHAITELELKIPILAVHINHSIQDESDQWQADCESTAKGLKVDFFSQKVDGMNPRGESPEAWARTKRYEAFTSMMIAGDILLLAHHQDDQIETFFLQLLRGSGPSGLAAMSSEMAFAEGFIGRPLLLDIGREDLEAYAQMNGLQWVEDPSNQDSRYDRNYLRHQVLPLLKQRWPSYTKNISRSIDLQSDACLVINASAVADYQLVVDQNNSLSVKKLLAFSDLRIRNIIRYWIRESGFQLPSTQKLRQVIDTILTAAEDRNPCVAWIGIEVRRYRDQLILMTPLCKHESNARFVFDIDHVLKLPTGHLMAKKVKGNGFKLGLESLQVRFRQGGEKLIPAGKKHRVSLKKYLQSQGVPPWLRDRIPLVYSEDRLVAVADMCVAEGFSVEGENEGWLLDWQEKEPVQTKPY